MTNARHQFGALVMLRFIFLFLENIVYIMRTLYLVEEEEKKNEQKY